MYASKVKVKRNEYGEITLSVSLNDETVITTNLTLGEAQQLGIVLEEILKG